MITLVSAFRMRSCFGQEPISSRATSDPDGSCAFVSFAVECDANSIILSAIGRQMSKPHGPGDPLVQGAGASSS